MPRARDLRRTTAGVVGLLATGALVAALAPSAAAARDPQQPGPARAGSAAARAGESYGNLWNILPPGSNGNATALDITSLAGGTATPTTPAHYADQLEMYDALTKHDPGSIKQADIDQLYKREDLTPATVVSTQSPRPGVTIQRDAYGVPFITGATYDDTEFGAGYAAIQDRMFLMDVLRHTGSARVSAPGRFFVSASYISSWSAKFVGFVALAVASAPFGSLGVLKTLGRFVTPSWTRVGTSTLPREPGGRMFSTSPWLV